MQCRMVELRRKEVINIRDGCRLGFVGDVEVRVPEGQVAALIVFMHRGNIERLRNHTENRISFSKKDKKAKKDTDGKRK